MSKKNDNCGSLSSKKPQNSRFMLSESFFILLISHTLSLFRKADARLGRRMSTVRHSIGVRTGLFSTLVQ